MLPSGREHEFTSKSKWGPFLIKKYIFSCKNNKITRGGRFELVFVNKFDGTISVAGVFSIL